jgi:salicylate hydroxylase
MDKVVHRADLASALYAGCCDSPHITFKFRTYVAEIDFDRCRLRYISRDAGKESDAGEWAESDVIIAADGVKSVVRNQMLMRRGEVDQGTFV